MKRDSNSKVSSSNFGLTLGKEQVRQNHSDGDFDNLFGLSKSERDLKKREREIEMERKRAETNAMQQILTEPVPQQSGMDMRQMLLIGGVVLIVCIGAIVVLKKKSAVPVEEVIDSATALTV